MALWMNTGIKTKAYNVNRPSLWQGRYLNVCQFFQKYTDFFLLIFYIKHVMWNSWSGLSRSAYQSSLPSGLLSPQENSLACQL